jgi:hypothetical protein
MAIVSLIECAAAPPAVFNELMAVVALANETNRLSNGYRNDVDDRFRNPLFT